MVGHTPGRRYGHVLAFCSPYIITFGGNTGMDPANDVWYLNVEKAPFSWVRMACNTEAPSARVYHSCAQCLAGSAAGMLIIFGGRNTEQVSLNDSWGLRKHRDGTWDWLKAPYRGGLLTPIGRYQHSAIFIVSTMIIIGGRTNNVTRALPVEAYDTETAEWLRFNSIKRFRHASWCFDRMIYVYGGFQQDALNVPASTILAFDLSKLTKEISPAKEEKKGVVADRTKSLVMSNTASKGNPTTPTMTKFGAVTISKAPIKVVVSEEKDFRLSSQVQVAMSVNTDDPKYNNYVRKVPVNQLLEESKKLNARPKTPTIVRKDPNEPLYSIFITQLLNPKKYLSENPRNTFVFRKEYVIELAREFQLLLEAQPTVIRLRTPLKVFGNLHGNFQDLMRMFDSWKAPTENSLGGDIDSVAYLFLGNYVDRGNRSLEVICLLMALKLKYPETIYLLRGSHEDRLVSAIYGFGEECASRLHENINMPDSIFQTINNVFAWLPLAAVIEDKVLCIHGGIGPSLRRLEDFDRITRPIELASESTVIEQALLLNCLWSDPADNEHDSGFKQNHFRNTVSTDHIFKFGADVAKQFLDINGLDVMIRSHEVVQNGINTFADSRVITIVSCTNYCGVTKNSACILVIKKTFEIVPKLLLPSTEPGKVSVWIDTKNTLERRPLTPPRHAEVHNP